MKLKKKKIKPIYFHTYTLSQSSAYILSHIVIFIIGHILKSYMYFAFL